MSLRDAIAAYRAALPPGETSLFAADPLDRLGVPVRVAPFRTAAGALYDGFGYGATPDEAEVGALGEISESVHSDEWFRQAEYVRGTYKELAPRRGPHGIADPLTLCLPAGSPYSEEMPLTWVEAKRWPTGEGVLVPLEFFAVYRAQMRGVAPLVTPITNGLGAGLSVEQALAHGLLELLQRDGNATAFRALDQGVVVDPDGLTGDAAKLLATLRAAGLDVTVKLAATDFGTVNVYAVGDDPREPVFPMMLTACGEAAHPDRDAAVRKALLEYAAARSRKAFMHGPLGAVRRVAPPGYLDAYLERFDTSKEEPRCLEAMAEWVSKTPGQLRVMLADTVFSERRRVPLADLPTTPAADPKARCEHVARHLIEGGCDVLTFDFSPPDSGIHVTKVVVAGLECETMSYYRIGERGVRRLLERGDGFVGLGRGPGGARPVRLTAGAEARLGGPAWLDPAAVDRLVGPLYPLYREPNSHAAQLRAAELAAQGHS